MAANRFSRLSYEQLAIRGLLDISFVMRERALIGYSSDSKKNFEEVVPQLDDVELTSVWKWVYNMRYQFNQGKPLSEYKGIYRVINSSKGTDQSTIACSSWTRSSLCGSERSGRGYEGGDSQFHHVHDRCAC